VLLEEVGAGLLGADSPAGVSPVVCRALDEFPPATSPADPAGASAGVSGTCWDAVSEVGCPVVAVASAGGAVAAFGEGAVVAL